MRTVIMLMVIAAFGGVLRAQSTNASLTGRVTDPPAASWSGRRSPPSTQAPTSVTKPRPTRSGEYYLANLPPGPYRIEIEKPGFKKLIKPDVILHVQDALEIDFEMTLGSSLGDRHGGSRRAPGEYRVGGRSARWWTARSSRIFLSMAGVSRR